MVRYVAFLRGVSPLNAKMPDLKRCFAAAGFTEVRTVLSSGNVVFDAPPSALEALAQQAEEAMQDESGRRFGTIVRETEYLRKLVQADPFAGFGLDPQAKRVVTFLRYPAAPTAGLPIERDGVRILRRIGNEVITAYVPNAEGPVFMRMLETAFGKDITTRMLETVKKCMVA